MKLVPFLQGSTTLFIHPNQIENWKKYHGVTVTGAKVNSIMASTKDDSVFLKKGGTILSVTKDELEVFARQYLSNNGFTVVEKQGDH